MTSPRVPGYRMRSACNACHFAKLRCSGGSPCVSCELSGHPCIYSLSNRLGRPKGVKNKLSGREPACPSNSNARPTTTPSLAAATNTDLGAAIVDLDRFIQSDYPTLAEGLEGFTAFADCTVDISPPTLAPVGRCVAPSGSAHGIAPIDLANRCTCIQMHLELLVYLRQLRHQSTLISVDSILSAGQRTLATWQQFSECFICNNRTDEETLLLSAMSLRGMLRLLQAFSVSVPTEPQASRESQSHRLESEFPTYSMNMSIGGYQIEGEERQMVGDMLALHTLNRIEFVISRLRDCVAKCLRPRTASTSMRPTEGAFTTDCKTQMDLQPVHVLLQGLDEKTKILRQTLHWKHPETTMKMYGGVS